MPNFKNARHSEDIHRELTDILRSLKDPRIDPMLSVVRTELSRDGSSCKVYVSSLSGLETARESVKGLKSAAGYIRREIGSRLAMRHTPVIPSNTACISPVCCGRSPRRRTARKGRASNDPVPLCFPRGGASDAAG